MLTFQNNCYTCRIPLLVKEGHPHANIPHIPSFQKIEFDDELTLNLFDSIYRGLPIKSFLTLRTTLNLNPFTESKFCKEFLIDGFKEWHTLEHYLTHDLGKPLYFDLEEKKFSFKKPRVGVNVNCLLDSFDVYEAEKNLERAQKNRLRHLSATFMEYPIFVSIMASSNLQDIYDTCVRFNGKELEPEIRTCLNI